MLDGDIPVLKNTEKGTPNPLCSGVFFTGKAKLIDHIF